MAGPLSGVSVIEMAGIGPGPFACMMLALLIRRKQLRDGQAE